MLWITAAVESLEFLLGFLGLSGAAVTAFMADMAAITVASVVRKLTIFFYAIATFTALYLLFVAAVQFALSEIVALMPPTPWLAGAAVFIAPRHGNSYFSFIISARVSLMAFTWGKTRLKWLQANF